MNKKIPLTQGKFAIVDNEDHEWLSQWGWYYSRTGKTGYAKRNVWLKGKRTQLFMHRLILDPAKDILTDHVNGNSLDNRRENLRECSRKENARNSHRYKRNTSGYMGASFHKGCRKWRAHIVVDGKQLHQGYFDDLEQAAHAYDAAALELHGEFATLNFPQEKRP